MANEKKQKTNKYLTYQDQEYERNLLLEKERKQQKKALGTTNLSWIKSS